MKYLSFDIEATGLDEHDLIIEFACVPFCTDKKAIQKDLSFHHFLRCPSFESLKPQLNPWVAQNNKELINKAHATGITLEAFKNEFTDYLKSCDIIDFFENEKITLFGKSLAAIDLPFLNRDLGWDYMREHFVHRQLDLSSISYTLIDMKMIPPDCHSGSFLMNYLNMGEVCHTALEDAINTAIMYFKLMTIVESKFNS